MLHLPFSDLPFTKCPRLEILESSGGLTLTSNADDQSFLDITVMRNGSQPGTLHNMLTTMEVKHLQSDLAVDHHHHHHHV